MIITYCTKRISRMLNLGCIGVIKTQSTIPTRSSRIVQCVRQQQNVKINLQQKITKH
jgi:hypothetical protein